MFLIIAGLILTAVTLCLTAPFWRKRGTSVNPGPESREADPQQALLASLADLEIDHARGELAPADYQRFKAGDERRLAEVLEKLETVTSPAEPRLAPSSAPALSRISAAVLSLLVVGSAAGIYAYNHGKQQGFVVADDPQGQGRGARPPLNPLEMVARLEARLRENPKDLQGQIMAGRSYMTLKRWEDAKKAWSMVRELDRRNHEAHFNLGWLLLQTRTNDDPAVFEEAIARFDKALINVPRDPTVLWYRGMALTYLGRHAEADANWTDAFQGLPPGSEDAKLVGEALTRLRAGKPPE